MQSKRIIIVGFILIVIAVIMWIGFYYNVSFYGKNYAQQIPAQILGMKSVEIPMDELSLQILETRDVLFREYSNDGQMPYYLCVIFSENNRKIAHPPELCLSGGGNTVEGKKEVVFNTALKEKFDAKRLIVTHNGARWMYMYWYKTGKVHSSRYMFQQLVASISQFFFQKSSCALIRLSMPIQIEEEPPYEHTQKKLINFAKEVAILTDKYLP